MTATCTAPLRIGKLLIGAIAETHISCTHPCGMPAVAARKSPALLLFKREGEVMGLDLAGNRYERSEIEERYPGCLGAFLSFAA